MQRKNDSALVTANDKPEYDGSILFYNLPREMCWIIANYLHINDLLHLGSTSTSMRNTIENASNCSIFTIWTVRGEQSRELYIAASMRRYFERYGSTMEQACRVLTSGSAAAAAAAATPLPRKIRVGLFGNTKLIQPIEGAGLFNIIRENILSLPEHFDYKGYKIDLGNVYGIESGLKKSASFDSSIADVFVCFASNTAEFDKISTLFSSNHIHSLGNKMLIVAHPPGIKIDTKSKLMVHAFFELTAENRSKKKLAEYCLNTLERFAEMLQKKKAPPAMKAPRSPGI